MPQIQTNFQLKEYNTFGINAYTAFYVVIKTIDDLQKIVGSNEFTKHSRFILGGGSNVLFTGDFPGMILHSQIKGIEIIDEDNESCLLRAGSGEIWDEFVQHVIDKNLGGIENLSGIPGSVGASPIQNIGAYGVEVKDVIETVEGIDLRNREKLIFSNCDCLFGYRTSIFKEQMKNQFFITHVTFRLKKTPHNLNTGYGAISRELEKYPEINIVNLRKVVCAIRGAKLPDPKILGNAGSFFKNPIIELSLAEKLKSEYPFIPIYPAIEGYVKLSAAWLIDQAGCKGFEYRQAASHKDQPLVLVNLGNATAEDILELAQLIEQRVQTIFGITLEKEVNIL